MEITFVRHAEAAAGPSDDPTDPPLTPKGRRQAEHLAESVGAWRAPVEVWVSPARRTRETAAPLCAVLGVEPIVAPWLLEIQGLDVEAFVRVADGADAPFGGEGLSHFRKRVTGGLVSELGGRGIAPAERPGAWRIDDPDRQLLFVGHGGSNAVAVEHVLGVEPVPWAWFRFAFSHTGVARLGAFRLTEQWVFGLLKHNNVSHLPRELRSS